MGSEKPKGAGSSIHAVDSGGPHFPIVFLHGSASSSAAFERQFSGPLAEHFRLIALDLPGHGKSGDAQEPSTEYSVQGMAASISQALKNLGVKRAVVFGWSLGGHVAIELMASTDLVAGLMLTGAPPIAPGAMGLLRGFQFSTNILLTSKPSYSPEDAARMVKLCFGDHAPAAATQLALRADGQVRTAVAKSFLYGTGMSDQRKVVQTATAPIAFIDGEHEPFIRLGYSPSIDIPTLWERRVLDDTGHAPFWERPETFNAMLQRFAFDAAVGQPQSATPVLPDLTRRRQVRK